MTHAPILHPASRTLIACVALLAFASQAMTADFTIPGTALRLPETLAGFSRGEVRTFPTDSIGSGTAVAYSSDSAKATFFIRPLDAAETGKSAADLVRDSLSVVSELEAKGIYSNVKKLEGADAPGSEWKSAAFVAEAEDKPITSYIYIRVSEGRSIKIRLSTPTAKEGPAHMKFIEELRKLVDEALKKP